MKRPPSARALGRAWLDVGTQSFGGGSSTLFMIRRVLVEGRGWISLREFTEAWALSQLSPGIHQVALAGLLGRRIAGPRGIVVSVAGMMLPAAIITTLLTALFGRIADQPLAIAALAGVGPVAAGMTIGLAVVLARPLLQRGPPIVLDVALIVASFALLQSGGASTVPVIGGGALVGALLLGRQRPTSSDAPLS
ncbi:MAG TPA: chromate transporter [Candidatus Limnocylindria bacterium]